MKKTKRLQNKPAPVSAVAPLPATDTAGSDVTIPRPGPELSPAYGNKDITRGFLLEASLAYTDDYVLMQQGGNDLRAYTEVLRDEQVKACFEQRRSAVISAELIIEPGGTRAIDKAAAEFLRGQLDKIDIDSVTDRMLHSVFYGLAAAEIQYEPGAKYLEWKSIKARNPRRFGFKANGEMRLRTIDGGMLGDLAAAPYFWRISYGTEYDDQPYGKGLAHWCFWLVKFKRNAIKYWMIYSEKFGTPTVLGQFPVGASFTDQANLLAAVGAVSTDSGIITPDTCAVDLLQATRSGSGDYKELTRYFDDAIAKAIIGQTLTTSSGVGNKATAGIHFQVRQDIVQSDANLFCNAFNNGPVAWLIGANFPAAALPRIRRVIEEPADLNILSERDQRLASIGFAPNQKRIDEMYGQGYEPIPNFGQPQQVLPTTDKQSKGTPGAGVNSSGAAQ